MEEQAGEVRGLKTCLQLPSMVLMRLIISQSVYYTPHSHHQNNKYKCQTTRRHFLQYNFFLQYNAFCSFAPLFLLRVWALFSLCLLLSPVLAFLYHLFPFSFVHLQFVCCFRFVGRFPMCLAQDTGLYLCCQFHAQFRFVLARFKFHFFVLWLSILLKFIWYGHHHPRRVLVCFQ